MVRGGSLSWRGGPEGRVPPTVLGHDGFFEPGIVEGMVFGQVQPRHRKGYRSQIFPGGIGVQAPGPKEGAQINGDKKNLLGNAKSAAKQLAKQDPVPGKDISPQP